MPQRMKTMLGALSKLEPYEPLQIFGGLFFVCSIGGLAAYLRFIVKTGRDMKAGQLAIQIVSALLNGGFSGTIVSALLWWHFGPEGNNIYLIIGCGMAAGFAGITFVDFVYQFVRAVIEGRVKLNIQLEKKDANPTDPKA